MCLFTIKQNPTPQLKVLSISRSEMFLLFNHLKILGIFILDKSIFKDKFSGIDLSKFSIKPPPVMCVNDLIVQGAKPLFFLDYIAVGKLNFKKTKNILKGIFKGCKISDCKLIGGETAEMPGIYSKDKFDLAGFSVGIVSKKRILDKNNVKKNNVVLAIPSNGIHSNGYSLVRSILEKNALPKKFKKTLLKPTRIYTREILKLSKRKLINSAAHITGGGLIENLLRSIPKNLSLNIDLSKIKIPVIFKWLKSKNISDREMLRTFNCGVGFCLIVNKYNVKKIKKIFPKDCEPYEIGFISKSTNKVKIIKSLKW